MTANSSSSEEEFFECNTQGKFCAVASPRGKGDGEIFTDEIKAYAKLKHLKGSRLKMFSDLDSAFAFAQTSAEDLSFPSSPQLGKLNAEGSPFASANQATLMRLRSAIEKADVSALHALISQNPMVLVTSSDTPTQIQIRLRYNALHIAAAAGHADVIYYLLEMLNSSSFWQKLYPSASEDQSHDRQRRVIDLYINSPELGNLDTPLHFASKFGHPGCVRVLASHPMTQLDRVNRNGESVADVAATRLTGRATNRPECMASIQAVLQEKFVVLLDELLAGSRLEQRTSVLPPQSPAQLRLLLQRNLPHLMLKYPTEVSHLPSEATSAICSLTNSTLHSLPTGIKGQLIRVRAFAGPIAPAEAETFRTEWLRTAPRSPSSKAFVSLRLTDAEKGYERQGRYLARSFGTDWYEYWNFIDDYVDLASEDGLAKLESYLNTFCTGGDTALPKTALDFVTDPTDVPSTPIKKSSSKNVENDMVQQEPTTSSPSRVWQVYRHCQPIAAQMLKDSLEDSSSSNNSATDDSSNSSPGENPKFPQANSSPIVNLLRRLTVVSPLRWLLLEPMGGREPLFSPSPINNQSSPRTSTDSDHKRRALPRTLNGHTKHGSGDSPSPKKRHAVSDVVTSSLTGLPMLQSTCLKEVKCLERSTIEDVYFKKEALHVFRALPSGDPELQNVGTLLATQKNAEASKPKKNHQMITVVPNLSRYPQILRWQKQTQFSRYFAFNY